MLSRTFVQNNQLFITDEKRAGRPLRLVDSHHAPLASEQLMLSIVQAGAGTLKFLVASVVIQLLVVPLSVSADNRTPVIQKIAEVSF
jgi:hypothetical protein